jgi:NAD(P)-dependent dehydrogenase (short-subunit alcohol dehydrogenase family)
MEIKKMKTIFITSSSSKIGKATYKLFTPKSLKGTIFITAGHRPAEEETIQLTTR